MKNIGIIGARKYQDKQSVVDLVQSLPMNSTIITSSCNGVCAWVREAASSHGLKVRIFSPDLAGIRSRVEMVERYYQRNRELISACHVVHAFISLEGLTGGTKYEVHYAKRLNKKLFLHWENGKIQRHFQQQSMLLHDTEKDFGAGWLSFFSEALA
jgi:hypothetical protein